ncbi:uncharacterized protein LOC118512332 isoform X2 [Anopheles stephensi]|uniref:uncharacterized protein LOC118512332 isoform X2 n=1 Tax=Anopheles stephensi TaxID=30069 RepID=UPI001658A44F|nr:uncharacterized protein LOC118512332 isoform X2 [Anopheles stephensi]
MRVKDPGGGIPVGNQFDILTDLGEPRRKYGKTSNMTASLRNQVVEEEKVLIMESVSEGKDLTKCNPFLLQKIIENALGCKPEQVSRVRGGKLLIKVKNENLAEKAERIKKIPDTNGNIEVKVYEHPTLNTTKGVIRCPDIEFMSEEEILSGLKDQKVTEVNIMKRKVENVLRNTKTAILTFNTTRVPRSVDFGFYPLLVDLYIPKPMRCATCLKIGHTKKWCKGERTCANCSLPAHEEVCVITKCVSCGDNHNTLDKDCPIYIDETEIQKIKTINRITYKEARAIRRRQCPTPPKKFTSTNMTYAKTTQNNATNIEQNTQTKTQNKEITPTDRKKTDKTEQITTQNITRQQTIMETEEPTTSKTNDTLKPITKNYQKIIKTQDGTTVTSRSLSIDDKIIFHCKKTDEQKPS